MIAERGSSVLVEHLHRRADVQGIPLSGYNSLFDRLLDHPNIMVCCDAAVRLVDGAFSVDGDDLPNVPIHYHPIDVTA